MLLLEKIFIPPSTVSDRNYENQYYRLQYTPNEFLQPVLKFVWGCLSYSKDTYNFRDLLGIMF